MAGAGVGDDFGRFMLLVLGSGIAVGIALMVLVTYGRPWISAGLIWLGEVIR